MIGIAKSAATLRAIVVAGAMVAGCTPATMAGMAALAPTTDAVAITGIGPGTSGGFRLGDGRAGRFRRSLATRAQGAVDDRAVGLTSRYGAVSFTIDGAPGVASLAGDCRFGLLEYRDLFGNRALSLETRATLRPFGFGCTFTRDGVAAGGMRIDALPPRRAALAERRAGEVVLGGHRLWLSSEHRIAEAPVGEGVLPVGYRLTAADGRVVGAVDIGAPPRVALPRDETRDAVLAAGLALALAWDPGVD